MFIAIGIFINSNESTVSGLEKRVDNTRDVMVTMVYEETFDMEERDKMFVATDGDGFLCIENKMTVRVGRVLMDRIESVICNVTP